MVAVIVRNDFSSILYDFVTPSVLAVQVCDIFFNDVKKFNYNNRTDLSVWVCVVAESQLRICIEIYVSEWDSILTRNGIFTKNVVQFKFYCSTKQKLLLFDVLSVYKRIRRWHGCSYVEKNLILFQRTSL